MSWRRPLLRPARPAPGAAVWGGGLRRQQSMRTGAPASKPIRWEYYKDPNRRHLYDTYRALATLKQQPAFAAPTAYVQNLGGKVKTISLTGADLSVVTYGNFDVTPQTATVTFPAAGTWYNYLDGTQLSVASPAVSLTLAPGQYAVYTSRKLTVPAGTTLATRAPQTAAFGLSLMPNPAAGTTTLTYALPTAATATIAVQNMLGQTIRQLPAARQAAGAPGPGAALAGPRARRVPGAPASRRPDPDRPPAGAVRKLLETKGVGKYGSYFPTPFAIKKPTGKGAPGLLF
ncbi:MAG: hypothetical protein WKG07_41300 [Hymenobacter sp.]